MYKKGSAVGRAFERAEREIRESGGESDQMHFILVWKYQGAYIHDLKEQSFKFQQSDFLFARAQEMEPSQRS